MSSYYEAFNTPHDNPDQPLGAEWPFKNDEVLICIDVECHCQNQTAAEFQVGIVGRKKRVCEVGSTILDSRDIANLAPDDRFQNTWTQFRSFDFVIAEHAHMRTGEHLHWCHIGSAEDFLFGTSRWVKKTEFREEFVKFVRGSFRPNQEANQSYTGNTVSSLTISEPSSSQSKIPDKGERHIVFLMFGVGTDKKWLLSLGVDLNLEFPYAKHENLQANSVARMVGRYMGKQLPSAADVFDYLGVGVHKAHNGGNDSVFEMQVFLAPFSMTKEQWSQLHSRRRLKALPAV